MGTLKTNEKIKKGLEVCNIWMVDEPNHCMECPYFCTKDCADTLMKHALALIQQLQAENAEQAETIMWMEAELEDMTARYKIADDCAKKKGEMNEKLYAELSAVKAERDDLKRYIRQLEAEKDMTVKDVEKRCITCKNSYLNNSDIDICPYVQQCHDHSKWEWCGVVEEE